MAERSVADYWTAYVLSHARKRNPPWKRPPSCDLTSTRRALAPSAARRLGRVRVHVNLHNGCIVVSKNDRGWRVAGYADAVTIKNVRPRVGMAGYARCKREQVRNVHAYLEGSLASIKAKRPSGRAWKKISYSCKTHGPYFYFLGSNKPFEGAEEVRLLAKGGKIEVWVKGHRKPNPPACQCSLPGGACECGLVDVARPAGVMPCERNPIEAVFEGGERVMVTSPTWPGTLNYWDVVFPNGEQATVPAWNLYTKSGEPWLML